MTDGTPGKSKNLPLIGIASVILSLGITVAIWPEKEMKVVIQYPKLEDATKACKGAPVEVVSISASVPNGAKKNAGKTTWLKVRPQGDSYVVACRLHGDWSEDFKKGEIIALPQGELG